jgi:hypothetical protein
MRSIQEEIVHKLSQGQMGAPYVFFPERWNKKMGSQREPCDIVIACNNCIVLMYMTSSSASREKKIDHNLKKQAKGWIKAWKKGQPLIGSNASYNFNIPYGLYNHIVIISVINCSEHLAETHEKEQAEYDVDICITMPQSALEFFASSGAGLADLLKISQIIQRQKIGIDALSLMKSYFKESKELGDPQNIRNTKPEFYKSSIGYLFAARSASLINQPAKSINYVLKENLNDLYLKDFIRLSLELTQLVEDDQAKLKINQEVYAVIGCSLTNYIYLVTLNRLFTAGYIEEIMNYKSQFKAQFQNKGVPIVSLQRLPEGAGYASVLIKDEIHITNCEQLFKL